MRSQYLLKGDVVRYGQSVRVFWTGYDWSPNLHNAARFATEYAARQSRYVALTSRRRDLVDVAIYQAGLVVQNVRTCEF